MQFRLRSFVRRGGRGTPAQIQAQDTGWSCWGLHVAEGLLDMARVFGREAPCFLEIGFGSGHSLLALASAEADKNFIGVETHKPGIGALFLGMQAEALSNIRVYDADVIDVMQQAIPAASLSGVQIFFPDPWPKRRHHQRRLIQPVFVETIVQKLKVGGTLHLATDWEDYAQHMLRVLGAVSALENVAGMNQFSTRSPYRPTLTKFERQALRERRVVRDLQFQKV